MSRIHHFRFRPPRRRGPGLAGIVVRLSLMVALLVVVLAVMLNPGLLYRGVEGGGGGSERRGEGTVAVRIAASRPTKAPPTTFRVRPSAVRSRPSAVPVTRPGRISGPPLGIDRAILNDVRDLEPVEAVPYFEAIRAVLALPVEAFHQRGLPRVGLADLFADSDRFRGRLVRISGNLRRLRRQELGPNPAGLDHIYVAQVRDSLSVSHIYAIVLVEDPQPGLEVGREVTFTGIFFKVVVGRDARGTLRRSPLLIGRRLEPMEVGGAGVYRVAALFGAVAGMVVIFVVVLAVLLYRRGDREFRRRFLRPTPPVELGDLPVPGEEVQAVAKEETGHGHHQP